MEQRHPLVRQRAALPGRRLRPALVPLDRVLELGRLWYGRHLAQNWRKWTNREGEAIFRQAGLTSSFWALADTNSDF